MLVIVGYVVVLVAVFGGFVIGGGHVAALFQPVELLIIGGSALGSFLVANSDKIVKATLKSLPSLFRGSRYSKTLYLETFTLLYDVLSKVRKEGLMSIEADVDAPDKSPIFSKYPKVCADHHVIEFLTDYLRIMVGGNLNAVEIESLMDSEIETHHQEGELPVRALATLGDSMPAFGIVAAVMGVVHTMASVGLPPAELGRLIAAALVGTFLGILLGYGFISPLSVLLQHKLAESTKMLECMKVTLLASLNGYAPQVAVEFGRKVLYSTERPSFSELEDQVKRRKVA